MAVRIRTGGQILCAAMHPKKRGDTYLHDGIHYLLSVELRVLVTEPMYLAGGRGGHQAHGEWWWRNEIPDDVEIDPFYLERDRLYTVDWARLSAPEEELQCTCLTARVAFARLLRAVTHDQIIVRSITPESGRRDIHENIPDSFQGVDRVFGTCSEHGPYELPLGSIDHGELPRRCPSCVACEDNSGSPS